MRFDLTMQDSPSAIGYNHFADHLIAEASPGRAPPLLGARIT
jgi:hypothetical protein